MATITRRSSSALITQLTHRPHEFDFYQTIRILEAAKRFPAHLGEGSDPQEEALRIRSHVTLSVSASDIHSLDMTTHVPTLTVNFMGIAGVYGPLPMPYTELILDRLRVRDHGLRDFFDVFNHRLVSLWYRSSKKGRVLAMNLVPEETDVGQTLLNLCGIPERTVVQNTAIPLRSFMSFAALFWQNTRSVAGLKVLLEDFFHIRVDIDEYQGGWQQPPEQDWTRIGAFMGRFQRLGVDTILGKRSWNNGLGIRLTLVDISWVTYLQALQGRHHQILHNLIRSYCGSLHRIQICARVRMDEIPATHLRIGHARLGQTTWLTRGHGQGLKNSPLRQLAVLNAIT